MSKLYNTRSTEAGDAAQESAAETTETTTTITLSPDDREYYSQLASRHAQIMVDRVKYVAKLKAHHVNLNDSAKAELFNKFDVSTAELEANLQRIYNDSLARKLASTSYSHSTEIALVGTRSTSITSEKHSKEISNIRTELTSEFKVFSDNIKSEILRIDNSIQQQREDVLQSLNVHRQQLHEEPEAEYPEKSLTLVDTKLSLKDQEIVVDKEYVAVEEMVEDKEVVGNREVVKSKQILDFLPEEYLINKIKQSSKRKDIDIIPPITAKKRMKREKKTVANRTINTVQLDHEYYNFLNYSRKSSDFSTCEEDETCLLHQSLRNRHSIKDEISLWPSPRNCHKITDSKFHEYLSAELMTDVMNIDLHAGRIKHDVKDITKKKKVKIKRLH